jgi:hypothetical protein
MASEWGHRRGVLIWRCSQALVPACARQSLDHLGGARKSRSSRTISSTTLRCRAWPSSPRRSRARYSRPTARRSAAPRPRASTVDRQRGHGAAALAGVALLGWSLGAHSVFAPVGLDAACARQDRAFAQRLDTRCLHPADPRSCCSAARTRSAERSRAICASITRCSWRRVVVAARWARVPRAARARRKRTARCRDGAPLRHWRPVACSALQRGPDTVEGLIRTAGTDQLGLGLLDRVAACLARRRRRAHRSAARSPADARPRCAPRCLAGVDAARALAPHGRRRDPISLCSARVESASGRHGRAAPDPRGRALGRRPRLLRMALGMVRGGDHGRCARRSRD